MLGYFLASSFGILLIAGAIFGRRFTVGLSARTATSRSYGRIWLVGNGLFLLAAGGTGLILTANPQSRLARHPEFWNNPQRVFFAIFESYNGLAMAIVGLVASVHFFRNHDWKLLGVSLAIMTGGSIFAYDGVWGLIKGI